MAATRKPKKTEPAAWPVQTGETLSSEPTWLSPRSALPAGVAEKPAPKLVDIVADAVAIAGKDPEPVVLAAVILAQALDRLSKSLGRSLTEAAAVGRYRGQ